MKDRVRFTQHEDTRQPGTRILVTYFLDDGRAGTAKRSREHDGDAFRVERVKRVAMAEVDRIKNWLFVVDHPARALYRTLNMRPVHF